jgi:hypothetical protein
MMCLPWCRAAHGEVNSVRASTPQCWAAAQWLLAAQIPRNIDHRNASFALR